MKDDVTPRCTAPSAALRAQGNRGGPRDGESNRAYKARRRMSLFIRQQGMCFYCGCDLVMAPDGKHTKHPPGNLATIEHLRDRFHPKRTEPNPGHERRWALACWDCNGRVGAERQAAMPIEGLRRRSQRGHSQPRGLSAAEAPSADRVTTITPPAAPVGKEEE